jgi:peptidoglycan/xylan/chitin deacetylase (PgdA/CDA1 family)
MNSGLSLCYHAISERWRAPLSVIPERFDAQLAFLAARGYSAATFTEHATDPRAGRLSITFDDAYRSVIELAKPILDRYGMVATVFVPTRFAGTDAPMSWPGIDGWIGTEDEPELVPMSWGELRALERDGWEIGSHTESHPHLTQVDAERLGAELAASRLTVEREIGKPCLAIAYPYGDHDERVVEAAREAGYEAAATLPGRLPRRFGPHEFPRIGVYHRDDLRRFRLKASTFVRAVRSTSAWAAIRSVPRPR